MPRLLKPGLRQRFKRSSALRKDFYDSLEVDNPDLREGGLFGRLPNLIALALSGAGWAHQLKGVDPNSVTSRDSWICSAGGRGGC